MSKVENANVTAIDLDRGSSNATSTIHESSAKYLLAYAIASLFLMTLLGIGVGYAIAIAQFDYSAKMEASMETRVTESKIESLRNEVAELRGETEAKPKKEH